MALLWIQVYTQSGASLQREEHLKRLYKAVWPCWHKNKALFFSLHVLLQVSTTAPTWNHVQNSEIWQRRYKPDLFTQHTDQALWWLKGTIKAGCKGRGSFSKKLLCQLNPCVPTERNPLKFYSTDLAILKASQQRRPNHRAERQFPTTPVKVKVRSWQLSLVSPLWCIICN